LALDLANVATTTGDHVLDINGLSSKGGGRGKCVLVVRA